MPLTGGKTATAADMSTVLLGQSFPDGCGCVSCFQQWKKFRLSGTITYARHFRVVDSKGPYFTIDPDAADLDDADGDNDGGAPGQTLEALERGVSFEGGFFVSCPPLDPLDSQ